MQASDKEIAFFCLVALSTLIFLQCIFKVGSGRGASYLSFIRVVYLLSHELSHALQYVTTE